MSRTFLQLREELFKMLFPKRIVIALAHIFKNMLPAAQRTGDDGAMGIVWPIAHLKAPSILVMPFDLPALTPIVVDPPVLDMGDGYLVARCPIPVRTHNDLIWF